MPTIGPKLEKQLFKNRPASVFQLPDDIFYDEIITESQSHCNNIIFTQPDIPKTPLPPVSFQKPSKKGVFGIWPPHRPFHYTACLKSSKKSSYGEAGLDTFQVVFCLRACLKSLKSAAKA